jgi:hypothetical protein
MIEPDAGGALGILRAETSERLLLMKNSPGNFFVAEKREWISVLASSVMSSCKQGGSSRERMTVPPDRLTVRPIVSGESLGSGFCFERAVAARRRMSCRAAARQTRGGTTAQ